MKNNGLASEQRFYLYARAKGRKTQQLSHSAAFDFLVDGWKIDVKSALPWIPRDCKNPKWTFWVKHNRYGKEVVADFYALHAKNIPGRKRGMWFLIKAPIKTPTIHIQINTIKGIPNRKDSPIRKWQTARNDFQQFMAGKYGQGPTNETNLQKTCIMCGKEYKANAVKYRFFCSENCSHLSSTISSVICETKAAGLEIPVLLKKIETRVQKQKAA